MRNLKIIEHISLDGVIQHSADEDDFPYGDWTAPYRSPAGGAAVMAAHGESFDLLLGRRTYDIWSGFWPQAPTSPIADRLNAAKNHGQYLQGPGVGRPGRPRQGGHSPYAGDSPHHNGTRPSCGHLRDVGQRHTAILRKAGLTAGHRRHIRGPAVADALSATAVTAGRRRRPGTG
jgi:hypothetical protein